MQIRGLELPRQSMDNESGCRKVCIALGHGIHFIVFFMIAAIMLAWMKNAKDINDAFEDLCEDEHHCHKRFDDINFYDVAFEKGPFTDEKCAKHLRHEIMETFSHEEMKAGNRWTMVYGFSGVVLLLVALNGIALIIGAWSMKARIGGACCGCIFAFFNLVSIIVTGVCRFNTIGQLSALSLTPSKYSGHDFKIDHHEKKLKGGLDDEHTYHMDGKVILLCWVLQMILCFT